MNTLLKVCISWISSASTVQRSCSSWNVQRSAVPCSLGAFLLNPERVGDIAEGEDHADRAPFMIAQRRGALLDRPFGQVTGHEDCRSAGADPDPAARACRNGIVAGLTRLRLEVA